MRPGIIGTLQLAVTFAFALPVALLGAMLLADGNLLGVPFLALSAVMLVAQQYLTTPSDLPAVAVEKAVGAVVKEPDEQREE